MNFKPEFNFEHLCYCVPRQYKNYATFLYAQSLDTELIMDGLMTISVELERVIIVKKNGLRQTEERTDRQSFSVEFVLRIKLSRI